MTKEQNKKDLTDIVVSKENNEVVLEIEGSKFYLFRYADHSVHVSRTSSVRHNELQISNNDVGKLIKVLEWYKSNAAQVPIQQYDIGFD